MLRPRWKLASGIVAGLSLLSACATGPRLESVVTPSQPGVTLTEAGVQLTIVTNRWSAYPENLYRYFTPIEVTIQNTREEELQIRYEDFFALDDGKHQYRAVPPGDVARAVYGALSPSESTPPGPILLAGRWYPYWPRYRYPYYPYYPYYGPYGPWGYWDPYYAPYGWPRVGAQEVMTLGLREGPLLPGASVQGFVFFQQATSRGSLLTVFWTPRLMSGAALPTLSAEFRIVP